MKVTYEFDTARETDYNVLRDIGDMLNTKYKDVYVTKRNVNDEPPHHQSPLPVKNKGVCRICEGPCGEKYEICWECYCDQQDGR